MRRDRLLPALIAVVVVLLGGAPRLLLAAGLLPEWARAFVWSDALFTYERGLIGHRLPYLDTPFEYPPVLGIIAGAFSLFFADSATYVAAWTVLLAATAGVCAYVLGMASAGSPWVLRYWSLTPQLLLLSTVNFDVLPATLLAAAAVAQRSGRELVAAAALATGTATKLFPLASAPIALLRARRRGLVLAILATIVGALYVSTSFLPNSSARGLAFYGTGIPSNIDSVWGLLERGILIAVPAASTLLLVLTLSGLALTYVLHVLPRAARAADPAVAFGLATVVLLFWSRLYSPQYSLWLLPFFALSAIGGRAFTLLSLADIGVFFTIYPLTLVRRGPEDLASIALLGALAAFVVLRQVALVVIWRSLLRLAAERDLAGRLPDLQLDREEEER